MKNKILSSTVVLTIILMSLNGCDEKIKQMPVVNLATHLKMTKESKEVPDLFQVSIQDYNIDFKIPALQSAAVGNYNDNWILIGGRKEGLHSMDNDPPAFNTLKANDSIWVVNLESRTCVGVPVPNIYARNLSATSQEYYQVNDKLYIAGGFTVKDTAQVSDWTSDMFFEIDIPSLVDYVGSAGATPALDQVFTKSIQSNFVQVTGGEMMVANNNFYIIGGQNYTGAYIPGNTGKYTNAIRKFNLLQVNGIWQLTDTLSVVDSVNLHRRDFNMTEIMTTEEVDSVGAVIYGGVFTKKDLAFRNPVYISGLVSGNLDVEVDTTFLQRTNLYTGAKVQAAIVITDQGSFINHTTFLGGISYMTLNPGTDSLSVPETGNELPFSNVITSFLTDGSSYSIEKVQLPPNEILPTYLGTNATFFPKAGFAMEGHPALLDLNRIFNNSNADKSVSIGYLYGGIKSPVPNTITSNGHRSTSVNNKLYEVFMTMKLPGSD
ncbi:hypothetical protein [Maribacter sp. R77961]|uniref:hypothetical protein n=1 Tax=Maribacter sp. R77961 TaxID=3093871 RepID=UPI0037C8A8C2